MPTGRNALQIAHRILIGSAVLLAAILLIHGLALFFARGDRRSLITGVIAAAAGAGLAVYLARFARRR
ncbi:MAG: hypothetical protein ACYDCL_07755 [Myxococcales bacterium]